MRVIAGKARRLPLSCPKGLDTRPTKDRIKETLFNILQNEIPGSVFVDLFSGSGAIGIEALSRGAKKAYFIDKNKAAIECIKDNLVFTKLIDDAVIIGRDASDALYSIHEEHVDIVFIDPPYLNVLEKNIIAALLEFDFIDSSTLIIVEADIQTDLEEFDNRGYHIEREKLYKKNKLIFLRKESE
jgi:16S rRNA (guanine966-N2)-methyltransferase